jgi:diguanylate cyclase (GGDEF)-like protein/PAS domain S-box-containing protein
MHRQLLDQSSDPIFSFGPDFRFLYANQTYSEGVGIPLEAIIGHTIWDVFPKDAADQRFALVQWVFEHRASKVHELLISGNGGDRYYQTTLKPIFNDHGGISSILGNSKDITDRKHAEVALKQNEAYTRSILDSVFDQIAVIDQHGDITAVNALWRRYALENSLHPGTPADHTDIGTNYLGVCRTHAASKPGNGESAAEGIQAVLGGRLPAFGLEYPCHSPDQKRWFKMRVTPLRGQGTGAVIAHTDITGQVLAYEAWRHSEGMLKEITSAVPGAVFQFIRTLAGEWSFIYLSKRIEELFEINATLAEHNYSLLTDCIFAEDRVPHWDSVERSAATLGLWEHEHRIRTPSGIVKWVRGEATPHRQPDGSILWTGILRDISERKRIDAALQESERKFRLIAENTSDGITIFDGDRTIRYVSPAVAKQLGYSEQEHLGQTSADVYALIDPEMRDALFRTFDEGIRNKTPALMYSYRVRHKLGHYIWREDGTNLCFTSTGEYVGAYVVSRDITERKRMEAEVQYLANFDALTQLPNRRMLGDRLGQTIASSKRSGRHAAVLVLDLDHFKPLNDEHGHLVGDLLLVEVARRLRACVREVDTVARFGGDEFVVLLSDLDEDRAESQIQVQRVAEKIRLALELPYSLSFYNEDETPRAVDHHCSASIGVALFLNHEAGQSDLLKWADAAMYEAKKAGGNKVRSYQDAGHVEGLDFDLLSRDGTVRRTVISATAVHDEQGRFVLSNSVMYDITELQKTRLDLNRFVEQLEERVEQRKKELRLFAAELDAAESRERQQLARDLHDDLGQTLAAARIHLTALESSSDHEARATAERIGELIDRADRSVRSLAAKLVPPMLFELGLTASLEWLGEEIERSFGLKVALVDDGQPKPLSKDARSILYRATRELLINSAKHASADRAEIEVERRGDEIVVRVADSGVGFDAKLLTANKGQSMGLLSVRERLSFIGGSVEIRSVPGDGAVITLSAPLTLLREGTET